MPADTNPYGDIFGGWLMAQMDTAAGLVSARVVRGRTVTVAVDRMSFLRPVLVGDEVSVFAELVECGRTSMRIQVEAWRRDRHAESTEKVTSAVFTFVALDDERRPTPLPAAVRAAVRPNAVDPTAHHASGAMSARPIIDVGSALSGRGPSIAAANSTRTRSAKPPP
ncbi:MAG TPA: acyl-CoA thioesterase [Phenylobacterium sp.]|nr:acyl-CoA thioesterase [Phenylobacterium sp.]